MPEARLSNRAIYARKWYDNQTITFIASIKLLEKTDAIPERHIAKHGLVKPNYS